MDSAKLDHAPPPPPPVAAVAPQTRAARRGRARRFLTKSGAPFGYLSPTMILIFVLMIIPIVMVISYSFKDNVIVQQNSVFVGFANYTTVLTDPDFLAALKNTFVFITVSTVAHLVLGLGFAMMLNTSLLSGVTKTIFRIIYILPWLFTVAVIAVIWRLMLDPSGVVNYLLTTLGRMQEGVNWLSDPGKALWALTFINVWAGFPFFMISILAGLQGISGDLYEAASVDGASPIRQFWNVTIPQLRPVLISMAVLDLIWTSQQFALIWMTTGGGPLNVTEMLSTYTYKQAFSSYEFATASAAAVIVLLLTMVLAFFYVRLQKER
ncbi:carbohydrate ABC transporter permease [Micromonospora sp. CPCC 206061]|uniref:carbohydrate ABC transporter permease n=1 Tax=Micromonospora sp. CPCC 206061 TaxID=3122410 RepID=UPI002FF29906